MSAPDHGSDDFPQLEPGDNVAFRADETSSWSFGTVIRHDQAAGLVEINWTGGPRDPFRSSATIRAADLLPYRQRGDFRVRRLDK